MKKIIFCGILVCGWLVSVAGFVPDSEATTFYPGHMGAFHGRVALKGTDNDSGIVISINDYKLAETSEDGKFKIILPWGQGKITAQKESYFPEEFLIDVNDDTSEKFVGYLYKASTTLAQNLSITPTASPAGYKIIYQLNQPSTISLKITDDTGTLYHAFNNQNQEAGDQQYNWDGKDANGASLPVGNYTVTLTAIRGDFKQESLFEFRIK